MRFWRCASERAQAQAVAAGAAGLIAAGTDPDRIAVLMPSAVRDGAVVCAALEERALPFRLHGSAAYFQRAEVRDLLAWLRLLANPADSGAAVRVMARPPVGLHSVDIARLTQLARRRKVDMPSAVSAALEGPQLTPEGRDRAQYFLRLYRPACAAFEDRRPDAFVLRLIERVGIRRQQVFATQADTVERLRNIAVMPELATAFMRREPGASPRDFARYLRAVADSGLEWEEVPAPEHEGAVQVLDIDAARGREFDHVFVAGLTAGALADRARAGAGVPGELAKHRDGLPDARERAGRVVALAASRARESLVLSWSEAGEARPAEPVEDARAALSAPEEHMEEELFGPAEGLHSTFRIMRDELLDTVAQVGGQLGEMRLDAAADVDRAVARFLELVKVAALIDRSAAGQEVEQALSEVNALLSQGASAPQREVLESSPLDDWLRDAGRDASEIPTSGAATTEPSLDPFIPRRGDGVMLSASDIETYRLCPLKYKFARVFRIPQESTINQRFGIVLHQVLERFHKSPVALARRAVRAVRVLLAPRRLRRLRRRAAVPRARAGRAGDVLGAHARRGGRARVVRAQLLVPAGPAPAPGPRGPRGPAARRHLRADRLQDRQGQDRGRPAPGHPAVRLPDGRARVVGRAHLGAELHVRDDRRQGAGGPHRGGAGPGPGHRRADRRGHPAPGVPAHPVTGDLQLLRLPDHLPRAAERLSGLRARPGPCGAGTSGSRWRWRRRRAGSRAGRCPR